MGGRGGGGGGSQVRVGNGGCESHVLHYDAGNVLRAACVAQHLCYSARVQHSPTQPLPHPCSSGRTSASTHTLSPLTQSLNHYITQSFNYSPTQGPPPRHPHPRPSPAWGLRVQGAQPAGAGADVEGDRDAGSHGGIHHGHGVAVSGVRWDGVGGVCVSDGEQREWGWQCMGVYLSVTQLAIVNLFKSLPLSLSPTDS